MNERKKLTDILRNGKAEDLTRAWQQAEAAPELGPVPKGEYECAVLSGELVNSRTNNTPGYKLTLQVIAGPHAGRRFWKDYWLTDAALPMAKRDLAKLGITEPSQLERPLPEGLIVRARVALRESDAGRKYNELVSFEAADVRPPQPGPFAPAPDLDAPPVPPSDSATPAEDDGAARRGKGKQRKDAEGR
jgi:hypothetical protein